MWGFNRGRAALFAALAAGLSSGTVLGVGLPGTAAQAAKSDGEAFYLHCREALEEGAPRLAMILCERSARSPDATAEIFETLGDVYRANGLGAEAKDAYRRAIRLQGDETRLRAKIHAADGVPDSAAIPPPQRSWLRPEPATQPVPLAEPLAAPLAEPLPAPAATEVPVLSATSLQAAQAPAPSTAPTSLVPEAPAYPEAESWGASGERISVETLPPPSAPRFLEVPEEPAAPPPLAAAAPEAGQEPSPALELEPAAAPAALAEPAGGSYRVQLAAMREEASAKALSARLVERYKTELAALSPRFEVKEIEGRGRFHRVQFTGLASLQDARGLCVRLRALGQDCFIP